MPAPPFPTLSPEPEVTNLGTVENATSGSRYVLQRKKGEGAFSTVYAAVVVSAPDAGLHGRAMQPMAPPSLRVGQVVAVKRVATKNSKRKAKALSAGRSGSNARSFSASNNSAKGVGLSDTADLGLAECDLLRRLTWTTHIFVAGDKPKDEQDLDDLRKAEADAIKDVEREIGAGGGVVKLYEVIETEDSLFFVMEFCAIDLFHCITSRTGLPTHIVKDLFTQIANAVHFCHENGVFHRDLKPENILIDTNDFSVRLADFGLATDEDWSDNFGCGSVRYMSPECLGIPLDTILKPSTPTSQSSQTPVKPGYSPQKNDVWSLGVILINLLFARNPWHSPKDAFCAQQYLYRREPALKQEFGLSDEFDAILRRCFDANPETRCSVLELRDLVWGCKVFVEGEEEDDSFLPVVPPAPPTQWGNVKKVYLGSEHRGPTTVSAFSDSVVAGSSAHQAGSGGSRRDSTTESVASEKTSASRPHSHLHQHHTPGSGGAKKKVAMSVLQKLLVTDEPVVYGSNVSTPAGTPAPQFTKGVEMKFGDSAFSGLSTSSGEEDEDEVDDVRPLPTYSVNTHGLANRISVTNTSRMETRPYVATRERSSSLSNNARPAADQIHNSPELRPVTRDRAGSFNSNHSLNHDSESRSSPSQQPAPRPPSIAGTLYKGLSAMGINVASKAPAPQETAPTSTAVLVKGLSAMGVSVAQPKVAAGQQQEPSPISSPHHHQTYQSHHPAAANLRLNSTASSPPQLPSPGQRTPVNTVPFPYPPTREAPSYAAPATFVPRPRMGSNEQAITSSPITTTFVEDLPRPSASTKSISNNARNRLSMASNGSSSSLYSQDVPGPASSTTSRQRPVRGVSLNPEEDVISAYANITSPTMTGEDDDLTSVLSGDGEYNTVFGRPKPKVRSSVEYLGGPGLFKA